MFLNLTEWELYKCYGFNNEVGLLDDTPGITVNDHGSEVVGDHILKYEDDDCNKLVFILDGATNTDFIYRLIWKG